MKGFKRLVWAFICLIGALDVAGQAVPPAQVPPAEETQLGIRFSYQLQFPSKNYVNAQNFVFYEAGHHLGYGGFIHLPLGEKVQFVPYIGLEHVFWPKSGSYSQACDTDSFPTFMAVNDSVPGRDFRMFNVVFEPALKIYVQKMNLFLKFQPILAFNIQRKVEQYAHTCGVAPGTQFVDYSPSPLRNMSKFTLSLGAGFVKEVRLKSGSGFSIEPGVKLMLSRLMYVEEADPNGLNFSLYPWGMYLNLGFFR